MPVGKERKLKNIRKESHQAVKVVDSDEGKSEFHRAGPTRKNLNSQTKRRIKSMKETIKKGVKIWKTKIHQNHCW